MEKKGYRVSSGEYQYIGLGEKVTCEYNDTAKQALEEMLKDYVEHIKQGAFPYGEKNTGSDTDPCRFCGYKGSCGKTSTEEE